MLTQSQILTKRKMETKVRQKSPNVQKAYEFIEIMETLEKIKHRYINIIIKLDELGINIFGQEQEIIDKIIEIPKMTYNKFHDYFYIVCYVRKQNKDSVDLILKTKEEIGF